MIFDPDAFLAKLEKNQNRGGTPAKVAKPAKVCSSWREPDTTLATLAALAALHPEIENFSQADRGSSRPVKLDCHPQLECALARELWPDGAERTFLIDTSVRAKALLLEQVPQKIDPEAWQQAVIRLSRTVTANGRTIPHGYDDQPLITVPHLNPRGEQLCQS